MTTIMTRCGFGKAVVENLSGRSTRRADPLKEAKKSSGEKPRNNLPADRNVKVLKDTGGTIFRHPPYAAMEGAGPSGTTPQRARAEKVAKAKPSLKP